MEFTKQHVITASYLKEWCDPNTPSGQTPFIWIASKDGKRIENKAPKNAFVESNFYTVYDEGGNRNLNLEHYLHKVEDDFLRVRKLIMEHKEISAQDFKSIILFIATTYARTKIQKSEQKSIWQELSEIYDRLNVRKNLPHIYSQIEQLQRQPLPFHIVNFVNLTIPVLLRMNLTIYETSSETGAV